MIGSGELLSRLSEVLATDGLLIDVFDAESSPLQKALWFITVLLALGHAWITTRR